MLTPLRNGLLSLFGLLALATSASAECAWVLWAERSWHFSSYKSAEANIPGGAPSARNNGGEAADIIGAYPTYKSCETGQEAKISQMLNVWRKRKADEAPTFVYGKGGGGKYTIDSEPGSNIISLSYERVDESTIHNYERVRYRCLPDTIDPRGPKGK